MQSKLASKQSIYARKTGSALSVPTMSAHKVEDFSFRVGELEEKFDVKQHHFNPLISALKCLFMYLFI